MKINMNLIGVQCQMSNLFISVKINLVGPDAKTYWLIQGFENI